MLEWHNFSRKMGNGINKTQGFLQELQADVGVELFFQEDRER
jgi:hypothetical protein